LIITVSSLNSPNSGIELFYAESGFFLADWVKTVFMEDSENWGKGDMQARNRTVVYLPT
jgi:hypothetical protein